MKFFPVSRLQQLSLITIYGQVISSLIYAHGRSEQSLFAIYMWSLWTMRNKRRHGEEPLPVRKAVDWIKDTAFDLWHILHPSKQDIRPKQPLKWSAPVDQWIKCNVDGCFFEHSRTGQYRISDS